MVQIGNLHLGKAETAQEPLVSLVEAALLWDLTTARYKCIEETQMYLSYAHDQDLQQLITTGLRRPLEVQANALEKCMNKYKIPLPARPPKSFNSANPNPVMTDEFILKQIFLGCQYTIDNLARLSHSFIFDDSLRQLVVSFLQDELIIFDKLCKYAKTRGWIEPQPTYNPM
ncbi:MAG: DUF3231 family protein [Bacillota bacterium]